MIRFNYQTAINQLGLGREEKLNNAINYEAIPSWVRGVDFLYCFLPYLQIIGDSREQDKWIERACNYYGIRFTWAKKDKATGNENLKEGDYTFKVVFPNATYDYTGVVAYERKGSVGELYGNVTGYNRQTKTNQRDRIKREFNRFDTKEYRKVVLMLEFGEKILDLIDLDFEIKSGYITETKNVGTTLYNAVMSWKQPNNNSFEVIQSDNHVTLFWLFLQDAYYFFRNDLRNECRDKNILKDTGGKDGI